MSEKIKYRAINGKEIIFRDNGKIFIGESALRSFRRNPIIRCSRLYGFEDEDVSGIDIPIFITTADPEFRNYVFDVFEKDLDYKKKWPKTARSGRLYIGDYYLPGFFTSSRSEYYLTHRHLLKKTMTFVPTYGKWINENKLAIVGVFNDEAELQGYDHPVDYDFDYGSSLKNYSITNNSLSACNFKIDISGPASNPSVLIGENIYNVDVTLLQGEMLTIDSRIKKVTLTSVNGQTVNCYSDCNENFDIFEKIATGYNNIAVNQNIGIEITLFQERSEPEWI